MDTEQNIALARTWTRHMTFRVVLPPGISEVPVVPNYGWTFSMYHPPEVKENPNLEVITELSQGSMVMFHGTARENWDNEVYCFSMVNAPNTQFFIPAGFFEYLVPVPVSSNIKRIAQRRFSR